MGTELGDEVGLCVGATLGLWVGDDDGRSLIPNAGQSLGFGAVSSVCDKQATATQDIYEKAIVSKFCRFVNFPFIKQRQLNQLTKRVQPMDCPSERTGLSVQ